MQLAIPVAVQFFVKGSRELSRNLAAYLSLVAIENAQLIADYVANIMDSIATGMSVQSQNARSFLCSGV